MAYFLGICYWRHLGSMFTRWLFVEEMNGGSLYERTMRKMYSVEICGTCIHERKCCNEEPCNDCSEFRSKCKQSHYEKVEDCEDDEK